ncbi:ZIP family metal transporter [Haliea sp.]
MSVRRALLLNLVSALTFPAGALIAYAVSRHFEVAWLVLFGAGNFIYIAASDLVPEIKLLTSFRASVTHFSFFALGLALTLGIAWGFRGI